MAMKFKNNAVAAIASGLTVSGTSVVVAAGKGALFPAAGGADYFMATLFLADGTNEIIKCTARSADTLTIVRAQEGTTARAWTAAVTFIECRVTQGVLDYFQALSDALDVRLDAIEALNWVTTTRIADANVTTAKILDKNVTYAKLPDIATNTLVGRATAGTGAHELITLTAAGRALLDDADAAAQRATMGAAASGAITASGLTIATAKLAGRTTAGTGAPEEIAVGAGLSLTAGVLNTVPASISLVAAFSFTSTTQNSDLFSNVSVTSTTNDVTNNYFEYVLAFTGLPNFSTTGGPGGGANFVINANSEIGGYQVFSTTATTLTLRVYHGNNAYDAFTQSIIGTLYMYQ